MTLEQTEVVDFIGVDKSSGEVVLTISDHLDRDTDVEHYIRALEGKLNTHLGFVEWPAAGLEDTELGVLMEPEVGHGETEVYAGVQA